MLFTSITEINNAVESLPVNAEGTRVKYPVLFKKAVCEYIIKKETNTNALSKHVRMASGLLHNWMKQYEEGLYTMKGVYSVSKTSLSSNQRILQQLNTEINLLQRKAELIKQCEELGIQVAS